jgi:hypothetical protein
LHRGIAQWLCIAACLPFRLAAAQLVVHVEAGGFGLPGAEVSVWGGHGRLDGGYTNAAGVVRLEFDRAHAAGGFVTARRLGYAPVRVEIPDGDSLTVALEPVTTSLPAVSVHSRTLRCPAPSDPSAEKLWDRAAARYQSGQQYPSWLGYVDASGEESVLADQRGYGDELRMRRNGTTVANSASPVMLIPPPPYATWERHMDAGGEYWAWRYSPLEQFAAWHFATEPFRQRHTLVVLGESAGSTTIGFCARERRQPDIDGELVIGPDTLFRSARWQFRVPHDGNDAGGEATFDVGRLDGNAFLVPIRGSSWSRSRRGRYEQERFERLGWRLAHTQAEAAVRWDAVGDQGPRD